MNDQRYVDAGLAEEDLEFRTLDERARLVMGAEKRQETVKLLCPKRPAT